MVNDKRFTIRPEARDEVTKAYGPLVALGILAISDMNRAFTQYSPIGANAKGEEILVGPYVELFDDQIEEVA